MMRRRLKGTTYLWLLKRIGLLLALLCLGQFSMAQKAYFIDGYHGGVWGHYPKDYTAYIVEQLQAHPDWKLNLEIEPETWDRALKEEPVAFRELQRIAQNQGDDRRIDFVNPTYGQSYLYNISGESIIRQFHYGIEKTKGHFPSLNLTTYSSEEPCFTSALPQILNLFGYQYASLKNPNTCWGGYTRNHGGELVNWIGPDGSSILTSPRYASEKLKEGSTWETTANANSPEYIAAAFEQGIEHPIGMTLQDAEWRIGPWLKGNYYKPTEYTTWTDYFNNVVDPPQATDWKFSQEDLQVSLVWGSQVLQKIGQEIQYSENKIIQAENLAAMAQVLAQASWPKANLDSAWKSLLLAQHHDCWIVPYNGPKNDIWADKVTRWTNQTNVLSDQVIQTSMAKINEGHDGVKYEYIRLFNTTSNLRNEWVSIPLPSRWDPKETVLLDSQDNFVPTQQLATDQSSLMVYASVPSMGYVSYKLLKGKAKTIIGAQVIENKDGSFTLETDLYEMVIDPVKGGAITKLLVKAEQKDYVDQSSDYSFNELRGYFYDQNRFRSSTETQAKVTILENSGAAIGVLIEGIINDSPFQQTIALKQGQKRIDFSLQIDWQGNQKIGEFEEVNYQDTALHKALYNDKYKLQALFPVAFEQQKIDKDAPFDVTRSQLDNTFFSTWDSIKNNILLNWVDVQDEQSSRGMSLLSDHVTSYAHGADDPLGLVVQYSGKGLWGMGYDITRSTSMRYALVPHVGNWESANIPAENENWKQPLLASFFMDYLDPTEYERSLIQLDDPNLSISSLNRVDGRLVLRLFNASEKSYNGTITLGVPFERAYTTNLLNEKLEELQLVKKNGKSSLDLSIHQFGIMNIHLTHQ